LTTALPLDGVTVLDFSTVGPASRCSRILGDYGATIIKVGAPPRKGGVQIQPPFFSYSAGRGTKRVLIDLKAPEGKDAFLRLATSADVIIESFRPGVVARLGIGYDDVRALNPRIVYCSTSGYGQTGPYAKWAGHDINYLGLGGYLACSGRRADGGPPLPGATVADSAAGGMHAAMAILAALHGRHTTSEGAYLDVAVADGVLSLMSLHIDEHLATGAEPGPGTNILTGRYACYDTYQAGDDKWLAVGAIEPAFFANLCTALGLEALIPHQLDDARQTEIRTAFQQAFRTRDRDAWIAELASRDTCVTPAYAVSELVSDPHLTARHAFVQAEHPREGAFRQLGSVLAGGDRERAHYDVPDAALTDTDALLRAAGLADTDIAHMRGQGIVA